MFLELGPWHFLNSSCLEDVDTTLKSQFGHQILETNFSYLLFLFSAFEIYCTFHQLRRLGCLCCSIWDLHILTPALRFEVSPNSYWENSVVFAQRLPSILCYRCPSSTTSTAITAFMINIVLDDGTFHLKSISLWFIVPFPAKSWNRKGKYQNL